MTESGHRVFAYGTLQQPSVQRAIFGGAIGGTADAIVGFELGAIRISDPTAIATSGTDLHPALQPAASASEVAGIVLVVDDDQLAAADAYEGDRYTRIQVSLRTGLWAWVYLPTGDITDRDA